VAAEVVARHPGLNYRSMHVDALPHGSISHPGELDVVVGSNLSGTSSVTSGAANRRQPRMAPSANLNPECEHPSMSNRCTVRRPTCRRGIANPIGQIWSAAMMLDIWPPAAAEAVLDAIKRVLARVRPAHTRSRRHGAHHRRDGRHS